MSFRLNWIGCAGGVGWGEWREGGGRRGTCLEVWLVGIQV